MKNINKQRAFTLVELLIVIAIIAVLYTAIVWGFGSVDDTAKADVMLANLQSLKSAFSVYYAEHDYTAKEDVKYNWKNDLVNRIGYEPLIYPDDGKNTQRARKNAELADPFSRFGLDPKDIQSSIPGYGKDPNSGSNKNAYFIGIKVDEGITLKTAEIIVINKGIIWELLDDNGYYSGKPHSTPGEDIGYPGGIKWADENSLSRQAWKRDIVNNPNNLKRLYFFYRLPIEGD